MALGVSSYSSGRRRRAEPPPYAGGYGRPYGPWQRLRDFLVRLEQALARSLPLLRLPLSVAALAHLVLLALYPAGQNALFGVAEAQGPLHTSLYQAPDALGFYATSGTDEFLLYKIYTQDGGSFEGVFPDSNVAPRLRYDRWAAAGDAFGGPYPPLHDYVARYIVGQLPAPPLRMELFAGRWAWDRNSLTFPWPGSGPDATLELRRLGTYNGLTRGWEPVVPRERRR
jgi:hypothetical protein